MSTTTRPQPTNTGAQRPLLLGRGLFAFGRHLEDIDLAAVRKRQARLLAAHRANNRTSTNARRVEPNGARAILDALGPRKPTAAARVTTVSRRAAGRVLDAFDRR